MNKYPKGRTAVIWSCLSVLFSLGLMSGGQDPPMDSATERGSYAVAQVLIVAVPAIIGVWLGIRNLRARGPRPDLAIAGIAVGAIALLLIILGVVLGVIALMYIHRPA